MGKKQMFLNKQLQGRQRHVHKFLMPYRMGGKGTASHSVYLTYIITYLNLQTQCEAPMLGMALGK